MHICMCVVLSTQLQAQNLMLNASMHLCAKSFANGKKGLRKTIVWITYVKSNGCKISSDTTTEYYKFNRTGYFKSIIKGFKSTEIEQTDCILHRQFKSGSMIVVKFCTTHYSHTPSLGHLNLTKLQRNETAKIVRRSHSW